MIYKHSAENIRRLVEDSGVVAKEHTSDELFLCDDAEIIVEHCLWMLDRMEEGMDPLKESRWIGWIFRSLETLPCEFITNNTARDWSRVDSHAYKEQEKAHDDFVISRVLGDLD